MNSVSYKNTSYLKKIIINFELLDALKQKDVEKIKKILSSQKNGKNTSLPKFEPHFQNLDLVDFFINTDIKRILAKFKNKDHVFAVVQEFINLGTSSDTISNTFRPFNSLFIITSQISPKKIRTCSKTSRKTRTKS